MMTGVRFLPLSGATTIGGSKLLLEFDGRNVLLDFGIDFHAVNDYYEEFLKPRSPCGIMDHVTMGVLPDVRGVYREDLILEDQLTLTGPEIGGVEAVLLSHAHTDHSGDLGFLRGDVPVVTSMMSAAIAKAMQDSSKTDIGMDGVYQNHRKKMPGDPETLAIDSDREMSGRDFCLTDSRASDDFKAFWENNPGMMAGSKKCRRMTPGELLSGIEGLSFEAHPVDHSIKGASGFVIGTEQGNIVYTGDIRLHGLEGVKSERFIEQAKRAKPIALIIEGTTIGRAAAQTSEKEVEDNIRNLLSDMTGDFAIADFGPRNIERLEIVLAAANESGRKLVVPAKDAYLLHAMHLVDPSIPIPGDDMLIHDCPRGRSDSWLELVIDRWYPKSCIKSKGIKSSPGDFILAFSFFDIKHLADLRPDKGHYIYSSSEAHSEEQEIDFRRLGNWLKRFNIRHYGFEFDKNGVPVFEDRMKLHASGHASEEDIRNIVRRIDPEIVIPVHTEHPEWFSSTFGQERKVLLPKQGRWMDLA